MKKLRLSFLAAASIAACCLALPAWAQGPAAAAPPAPPPQLKKVKDDIYLIQNANNVVGEIGQFGGNVTVILTKEGVILVDSKNPRMHDDIVQKVRSLTDQPIKYVVLTHNHADHSGGAAGMKAIGATLIISEEDRENMARTDPAGLPQIAYRGHAQMFLGDKELELNEYRGHTSGDTTVYLPKSKVIIVGDLITTPDEIPEIVNYGDNGSWTDLIKSLNRIARVDFDVLIGGHGPTLTKPQFLAFKDKLAKIGERFRALNREKKTPDEIRQTLVREFNWGNGPAAGIIPGMVQELR